MAIIDSSGIKRDTDASTPLERPSHPSRTPSHSNGGSLPRKNNLSNADQLKKKQTLLSKLNNVIINLVSSKIEEIEIIMVMAMEKMKLMVKIQKLKEKILVII